jgi:hypothetical protein
MGNIIKSIGEIDRNLKKSEIEDLAKANALEILDKEQYDLLKVFIEFKRYETYLKTLMDSIKSKTIQQAKTIDKDDFEFANVKISVAKHRKFDFSNDNHWRSINAEFEYLKKIRKERESLLKGMTTESAEIVNEMTGEIEEVFAPKITYKQVLRVTL